MKVGNIQKINLKAAYQSKIKGFGEIYEIESVKRLQKRLLKKFGSGTLFLSSNADHSGRGVNLNQLENLVKAEKYRILAKGYVDSLWWKSNPRLSTQINPLLSNRILVNLVKLAAVVVVHLEFIWEKDKLSHMVYVLGTKR